jgi:hypothetical protein
MQDFATRYYPAVKYSEEADETMTPSSETAIILHIPPPPASTPTPSITSTATSNATATLAVPTVPTRDPSLALAENDIFEIHFPPDKSFFVNGTMLQFDGPNLFSTVFLSGFHEQSSRRLVIVDRSPELFPFILDYLRGYAVFPIARDAVPARLLPLSKTYDYIRRDAAYYSLVQLDNEARRWMRHELFPQDAQAVLKLDFAPFRSSSSSSRFADLHLECNLADTTLLRKRYFDDTPLIHNPSFSILRYGPFPWKNLMDTLRQAHQNDPLNVIQPDGSAFIDAPPVFIKPPRSASLETTHRNYECARIFIPAPLTTHLLDPTTRPMSLTNTPTLRIHATNVTMQFIFSIPPRASFIFHEREAAEGLATLLRMTHHQNSKRKWEMPRDFPIDVPTGFRMDVDDGLVRWADIVQWAHRSEERRNGTREDTASSDAEILCQDTFAEQIDSETNVTMVPPPKKKKPPQFPLLCLGS